MSKRDLIQLSDLSADDFEQILSNSISFYQEGVPRLPLFFGPKAPNVASVFFEDSTRTKMSFQLAFQNLDLNQIDLPMEQSSLNKGETELDSLQTLNEMGVDIFVIRSKDEELQVQAASKLNASIISAGSGKIAHPTQTLLDLACLKNEWKSLEAKKILFVGDTKYSRVVSSHIQASKVLHYEVQQAGPSEFLRDDIKSIDINSDEIKDFDLIYLLRAQKERHTDKMSLTNEDYNKKFGWNESRLKNMKKDALIMHPGPFIRGMELNDSVLEDPRSRIWSQVQFSVPTRMACIEWIVRGKND